MSEKRNQSKRYLPERYKETPKDEVEACLNCPFEEPRCGSDYCPLRKIKAQKRLKARMEDDP